jgi:hypothetical protein
MKGMMYVVYTTEMNPVRQKDFVLGFRRCGTLIYHHGIIVGGRSGLRRRSGPGFHLIIVHEGIVVSVDLLDARHSHGLRRRSGTKWRGVDSRHVVVAVQIAMLLR